MTTEPRASRSALVKALLPTIVGNVVLPYVVYLVAVHAFGLADVPALALSAVPAVLTVLAGVLRNRRINVIGAVVLGTIALGLVVSVLTGDGRFAVARDAVLPLAIGLAMLGSLIAGRPLLYHVLRALSPDEAVRARLADAWATMPGFRTALRRCTGLWALLPLLAVAVRLTCAFTLPVGTSLPLLQLVEPVVWLALVLLTRRSLRTWLRPAAVVAPTPVPSP